MHPATVPPPFRPFRFFSLSSLLGIVSVAFVIIFFYRFMVVRAINDLSAELNTSTARTAAAAIHEELGEYIGMHASSSLAAGADRMPDPALRHAIDDMVDGSRIVSVKIYARDGQLIYSTTPGAVGRSRIDDPDLGTLMRGEVVNRLVYRDHLNPFDQASTDDNLIQTYLPIVDQDPLRPVGVFAVYSDANDIVHGAETKQLIVIPVVLGSLLVLYLLLLSIVHRASRTIERQRGVILERTRTLELLSAKLLNAQEDERKRIAENLHEDVGQSLLAIKLAMQSQPRPSDGSFPAPLVELLQDAIEQIRRFAMELRPSALDDFGVTTALQTCVQELRSAHPGLLLTSDLRIADADLPRPLKTLVFRTAQDTLNSLIGDTGADNIGVTLSRDGDRIRLAIKENARACRHAECDPDLDDQCDPTITLMRERALLSGGSFETTTLGDGTAEHIASWSL